MAQNPQENHIKVEIVQFADGTDPTDFYVINDITQEVN